MKRFIIFIFVFLAVSNAIAQNYSAKASTASKTQTVDNLCLPAMHNPNAVVRHKAYVLEYSEANEQALWVAYLLTRQHAVGNIDRKDCFRSDPAISTGSATLADYRKSGYDRGHLAPVADMRWNVTAMKESFLMSNMSPQIHSFNGGVWARMEEKLRLWALEYDSLYIVTGPVLSRNLPTIGANHVSVPQYFYKVILDPKRHQAIGFIIKHENSQLPLKTFAVTVDSVEQMTGIDFYPALPDKEEKILESNICIECWNWN